MGESSSEVVEPSNRRPPFSSRPGFNSELLSVRRDPSLGQTGLRDPATTQNMLQGLENMEAGEAGLQNLDKAAVTTIKEADMKERLARLEQVLAPLAGNSRTETETYRAPQASDRLLEMHPEAHKEAAKAVAEHHDARPQPEEHARPRTETSR